jgi:hypothetical protein
VTDVAGFARLRGPTGWELRAVNPAEVIDPTSAHVRAFFVPSC